MQRLLSLLEEVGQHRGCARTRLGAQLRSALLLVKPQTDLPKEPPANAPLLVSVMELERFVADIRRSADEIACGLIVPKTAAIVAACTDELDLVEAVDVSLKEYTVLLNARVRSSPSASADTISFVAPGVRVGARRVYRNDQWSRWVRLETGGYVLAAYEDGEQVLYIEVATTDVG